MLGVRYYIAFSSSAVKQADAEPALSLVATSGVFRIYRVADSDLVQGLAYQPAVVEGASAGGVAWQDMATSWYLDPARRSVYLAADGPASWSRVDSASPDDALDGAVALPAVSVGDIHSDDDTITFTVDRPGVPVLVKTSYFPNWEAKGAAGPYRVAPNLMVVVPTSTQVRLVYGRTSVDWLGIGMTAAGVVALVAMALVRRRGRLPAPPAVATVAGPLPFDADDDARVPAGGPVTAT
jgi:hypothetical protein